MQFITLDAFYQFYYSTIFQHFAHAKKQEHIKAFSGHDINISWSAYSLLLPPLLSVCSQNEYHENALNYNQGLWPDTQNCGLRMRRECRERFPRHRGLAIPPFFTARAATCEVSGGENVPGIPGACATHNFAYLIRSLWAVSQNR